MRDEPTGPFGLMRQINFNLYPPDGYCFKEKDGSFHRSDGWKNLAEKIRAYRELNRFEIGDPLGDIMNQVCAKYPHFCNEPVPFVLQNNSSGMTHNQRVLAWLAAMLGYFRLKALKRVDRIEANRRAEICARCPMQMSLNTSCGACITMVETTRNVISSGVPFRHQNLLPCSVLGEDMTTSVEIIQTPADNAALPGHCWRKK